MLTQEKLIFPAIIFTKVEILDDDPYPLSRALPCCTLPVSSPGVANTQFCTMGFGAKAPKKGVPPLHPLKTFVLLY